MTLEVKKLTTGYTKIPVIHDIEFTVKAGEICGLIGLNGAGKSTTIKSIIGLLQPFSGEIRVADKKMQDDPRAYRQAIAVIPESPVLYEELTLREHIEVTAKAYQQDTPETIERALQLVEKFRLTKQLDWFPAYFSKGMKQKVLIVCALMLDVPLYVVDEPFLGLDPLGIRTLLACIEEKRQAGAAVLMSTHVLDTAERYCDRFVLIHEGKVSFSGTIEELQMKVNQSDDQVDSKKETLEDLYFTLTNVEAAHE